MPRLFFILLQCFLIGLVPAIAVAQSQSGSDSQFEIAANADNAACGGGCPDSVPVCDGTKCVPCTVDAQCGTGRICDTAFGQCIPRPDAQYGGGCSIAVAADHGPHRTSDLALLTIGALLFFFCTARRGARFGAKNPRAFCALLILALFAASPGRAVAQTSNPTVQFNTQTFRPVLGPGNVFSVDGTLMPRALWPMGGVIFEYANRPLRLYLSDTHETYAATVSGALTAHAMLGAGITRYFSAAIDLPIVLYQGFDSRTPDSEAPYTPTTSGVGDLRLMTKLRLVNNEDGGFGLAAVPELTFPSGSLNSFRGDGTFAIEPRLAADYRFKNGTFIALNLGYYLRTYNRTVDFGLVRVADTLRYGLGLGVPIAKGLSAAAELVGAASFSRFEGGSFYAPLEGYLGARYSDPSGVEVTFGGGAGFTNAVGSAQFRLFLGVVYAPRAKPAAPPRPDDPPPEKEPALPPSNEPDTDGDGVFGSADVCPNQPGPKETLGCPDSDKDGIADQKDKCPNQPGPALNGGCPSANADSDKDGVSDKLDRCPNQPGPAENSGCPDADEDKDGVVDRLDKCPAAAGPKNNDGCPLIDVHAAHIRLVRPIRFKPRSAALEPDSKALMQALAKAMNDDSSIKKVQIEVAASGDKKTVKRLAPARALTLLAALVEAEVPRNKLQIKPSKRPGEDDIGRIEIRRGPSDRSDRTAKSESVETPEPEKPAKPEKVEKVEKPEKPARPEKVSAPDSSEKPDQSEKGERSGHRKRHHRSRGKDQKERGGHRRHHHKSDDDDDEG